MKAAFCATIWVCAGDGGAEARKGPRSPAPRPLAGSRADIVCIAVSVLRGQRRDRPTTQVVPAAAQRAEDSRMFCQEDVPTSASIA